MAGGSERLQAVACPNCGDALPARALGLSVNTACVSCGAVVDTVEQRNQVLFLQERFEGHEPLIPLGTRGHHEGREWEIIGWQLREDLESKYRWEEYLLFNPRYGYRWLSWAEGHWSWIREVYSAMHPQQQRDENTFRWQGRKFRLYHKGQARTRLVLGEFYWRLRTGYTVAVRDYIAPPQQISLEIDSAEISCSLAHYLTPRQVEQIFRRDPLPLKPKGVAPNQPRPYPSTRSILALFGLVAVALIVTQIVLSLQKPSREVAFSPVQIIYPVPEPGPAGDSILIARRFLDHTSLAGFYDAPQLLVPDSLALAPADARHRLDETGRNLVVPEFDLGPFQTDQIDNLAIECRTSLRNNWMSLEFVLFNQETQQARYFDLDIEYYTGIDSEGGWSEGSQTGEALLSSVEAGQWRLAVAGVAGTGQIEPIALQVRVTSGVTELWNFTVALAIVAVLALIWVIVSEGFEKRRWANSDYSPYYEASD